MFGYPHDSKLQKLGRKGYMLGHRDGFSSFESERVPCEVSREQLDIRLRLNTLEQQEALLCQELM